MIKYKIQFTRHREFGVNNVGRYFKSLADAEEYKNVLLQDPTVVAVYIIEENFEGQ